MFAAGELYVVFVRAYKDAKIRAGRDLTDYDLCGVLLKVIEYMEKNAAPQELQDLFIGQLMKQYNAAHGPELKRILKENAAKKEPASNDDVTLTNENNENDS